jgi:hypothetical protein
VGRIGALVHALGIGGTLWALAPGCAIAVAPMVAGCADEQAAETHIKRLKDPIKRTAAVERLIAKYNDALTSAKADVPDGDPDKLRAHKNVKDLLDKIVPPLAELAEKADLDQKSQGNLLAMLADTRDPRVVPALVKALDAYKPDDKRPDEYDIKINEVVRNLGEMKEPKAAEALLKLFQNMHFSWPKAKEKGFSRTIQDAMLALQDKSWEDPLIKMLGVEIKTLSNKEMHNLADQMYWQNVAALLLGNMKSQKAVPALIKVVLSPFKSAAGVTAIAALIKIGKPSIDAGVKLLSGEDKELADYAEKEFLRAAEDKGTKIDDKVKADAKKAGLDNAVIIVANIGRQECVGPMLAQIEKGDATSDVVIARELPKLPPDPKVNDAFKKVWEATKLDATIPPGYNAKEALTDVAGAFLDQELAGWVGKQALELKGEDADLAGTHNAALTMLLKVGGPAQMELIDKLAAKPTEDKKSTLGKAYEKELKIVRDMVKECGDKGDCYFKQLEAPAAQKESGFKGIKAAYMSAIFGGDGACGKFVGLRPSLTNPAVVFVTETMIDRTSLKCPKDAADKLQALVDKALASKDEERAKTVNNLKTVVNRMRARTQ